MKKFFQNFPPSKIKIHFVSNRRACDKQKNVEKKRIPGNDTPQGEKHWATTLSRTHDFSELMFQLIILQFCFDAQSLFNIRQGKIEVK